MTIYRQPLKSLIYTAEKEKENQPGMALCKAGAVTIAWKMRDSMGTVPGTPTLKQGGEFRGMGTKKRGRKGLTEQRFENVVLNSRARLHKTSF